MILKINSDTFKKTLILSPFSAVIFNQLNEKLGLFLCPFRRIKARRQNSPSDRKDFEIGNQAGKDVSSEEGAVLGDRPQADWDMVADSSDDVHLYVNKFQCFQQMLGLLEAKHECIVLSKQIRKLPKMPRCNKHLLNNGNPRCMAVVEISYSSRKIHIIEVDTSDAAKPLSTKLLVVKESGQWYGQLNELERELVKGSLRWPIKYLNSICVNKRHFGIPHPQTESSNKGLLDSGSISKWAARVHSWISQT